MARLKKTFEAIMLGNKDTNIIFTELVNVLIALGFELRVKGDHYIFTHEDVVEIINIQPNGKHAKKYQVKQVRSIFKKYGMEVNE